MTYTLLIVACLVSRPADCQRFEHPLLLAADPSMAFVQAQTVVVAWPATHPGLMVTWWRLLKGRSA